MSQTAQTYVAFCIRKGSDDDLELRKAYAVLPATDKEMDFLRVVDDSGEDYLYPAEQFVRLELTPSIEAALGAACPKRGRQN